MCFRGSVNSLPVTACAAAAGHSTAAHAAAAEARKHIENILEAAEAGTLERAAAALRGIELPKANDDKVAELLAGNPEFTEEQVRALLGCLYGKVLSSSDNTAEAALREAPTEMNRLRVMYLIYHYDLYFEK